MFEIGSYFKKSYSDSFVAVSSLLKLNGQKFTFSNIRNILEEDVDFNSLYSVKNLLLNYNIRSEAVKRNEYDLSDFETPYICLIQKPEWANCLFTLVTKCQNDAIYFVDPKSGSADSLSELEFKNLDKGIVLLLDTSAKQDEPNYEYNLRIEKREKLLSGVPYLLIIFSLFAALGGEFLLGDFNWTSVSYTLTSGLGLCISFLLVWYEVDSQNLILKEVCNSMGKKANCQAVLSSSGSKIFGISWSTFGLAYFCAFFLCQCLYPGQLNFTISWSICSVLVSPYLIYSLYYQGIIVRQWCALCLAVQLILGVNFTIATFFFVKDIKIDFGQLIFPFLIIALLGLLILAITHNAVIVIKSAKKSKHYKRQWNKLRFNSQVFSLILKEAAQIEHTPNGLGIVIGNIEASREIIKVCDPYCVPCSKAHPILNKILERRTDFRMRIIFNVGSNDENDPAYRIVSHFLSLQSEFGEVKVHEALNEWYLSRKDSVKSFIQKYPIGKKDLSHKEMIGSMGKWIDKMKVRATPTIFIDGYELPEIYMVNEMENLF